MIRACLLYVLVILLLAACGPSPQQQAAMLAGTMTAIVTAWTPTPPTPSATMTPSPTPTHTPAPTLTPTPTLVPTGTSTPTQTPDPRYYFAPDRSYALIPPEGWRAVDIGLPYPALVGPMLGNTPVGLNFFEESSKLPLGMYSAMVQDSVTGKMHSYSQVSEDFLTTDDGKDYFRWEFTNKENGTAVRSIVYFFDSGDNKLTIAYARPNNRGAKYDALVEEAMKTVRFPP